jgi:hypothetical protein
MKKERGTNEEASRHVVPKQKRNCNFPSVWLDSLDVTIASEQQHDDVARFRLLAHTTRDGRSLDAIYDDDNLYFYDIYNNIEQPTRATSTLHQHATGIRQNLSTAGLHQCTTL